MSSPAPALAQARRLRIFISYASEDLNLAVAIARGLREALGETFAEINYDKWVLQAGEQFKSQLETRLARSDILIIVYTGLNKQSHGFTGWEVGFFEGVMRAEPGTKKRIIPMYLESLPDTATEYQGIGLNIPRDYLRISVEEFEAKNDVHSDDAMCLLIQELQDRVDECGEEVGIPKSHNKPAPVACFRSMRMEIFRYLRTRIESEKKPQKQITIKTTGAAFTSDDTDLPQDATLTPVGDGYPMSSIFGLPDREIKWAEFKKSTSSNKQKESWKGVIARVTTSSLTGLDVDNSQIILSDSGLKSYRVILTTAVHRFDDSVEFNLYFVEVLQREEYGDKDTTLLLKGLELVCRYRFMFLEGASKFSGETIEMSLIRGAGRLPEMATELLRELDLIANASLNAGLDDPTVWNKFVDWNVILQMANTYAPAEESIRQLIGQILQVRDKSDQLLALGQQLSTVVKKLAAATEPQNTLLIKAMSRKLYDLVESGSPMPAPKPGDK